MFKLIMCLIMLSAPLQAMQCCFEDFCITNDREDEELVRIASFAFVDFPSRPDTVFNRQYDMWIAWTEEGPHGNLENLIYARSIARAWRGLPKIWRTSVMKEADATKLETLTLLWKLKD